VASTEPMTTLDELRAGLSGRLITPTDAEYDAARVVVEGTTDLLPAVIVRVANADDVARAIRYARETGAELAVRSGGHSGAGHGTTEGGVVIDLRDMKGLEIDPEGRTAWAETGLNAGEVTTAAAEHGLAVGFGDTASVGIGGITTGGGIGYLVRKHGLTIDSVLAAEVVTADGEILAVDADQHPDLFWGIRGGGGNLGVVTRFKYRLHPVPEVTGGILVLPATVETVAGFMAAAEAASEDLSTNANVMNCPPMPFVPEEHHGSLVILAMLCFAGDADAGERAMAPFRQLAEPLADLVRPMTYPEMYPPEEGNGEYRPTAVARTLFMDHVGVEEAAAIVEQLEASDAPMRAVQLRVLGGAMARVAPDATAFAHRSSRVMGVVVNFFEGPEDLPRREAWVTGLLDRLVQGDTGAYVNFLGDEGPDRVRAAYPGSTWERLAALKARYDPTNLFRRNQNIAPATEPR
jgi:FAD/FMN-containing dehydrogenase